MVARAPDSPAISGGGLSRWTPGFPAACRRRSPETPAVTAAGATGVPAGTRTTTRAGRYLTAFLVAWGLAASAAAGEEAQPPRDTRTPDRSQTGGARPRYGFSAFGGFRALQIDSRLFDANEVDFGITDNEFNSGQFGFELDYALLPMVEIVIGFDTGEADTSGAYRELVYEDGSEIEHSAVLGITEYTVGARFRPLPEARTSPYLVLGVSRTSYEYSEAGEFVNFENFDIFYDEFGERQSLVGFFAGAGLDFALARLPFGRRVEVFGELRYGRSGGTHRDEFQDFGDFSVAPVGARFGLRLRF